MSSRRRGSRGVPALSAAMSSGRAVAGRSGRDLLAKGLLALAVVVITWLVTGAATLLAAGVTLGEVPHVVNSASARPPRTVQLEELWRFGGEDGDVLLGAITKAVSDSQGYVYLLDTQLFHVLVLSPDGEYVRTLAREGDGPGEVRRPRDVVLLPDRSVGLLELFPAKLVKLTREGEPRGTLVVGGQAAQKGGFTSASRCVWRGGTLMVVGENLGQTDTGQSRDQYLCRLRETGEEQVRFREATMILDFQNLCFVERQMEPAFQLANAVGPDGRVYAAEAWDRYAIDVYRPDGSLERVIEREFTNRKRTAQELRRINALYDAAQANTPYEIKRTIEPSPAVVSDLSVGRDGKLWVLHSRSGQERPPGVMQTYDVFDPDGRYLQQVSLACEGDAESDGITFLDDGRLLLIKGYVEADMARSDLGKIPLGEQAESSPLEIICYRTPAL